MTLEPAEKSVARVLSWCKCHDKCGDFEVYEAAKLMLHKIKELTAAEYEDAVKQITGILFV